jgi:Fur family ferric uptake transcriptional regulator
MLNAGSGQLTCFAPFPLAIGGAACTLMENPGGIMPHTARQDTLSHLEKRCLDKNLKMTEQRRIIARVLSESSDHPDVEMLHARASAIDPKISIATVYRTMRLFEEAGIIERHDFGDGRSRYETMPEEHHDHLIDLRSGRVIEFSNEAIEALQKKVAKELGYELVDHRLELYCIPVGHARKHDK